jgi:hypothetical protein
MTCRLPGGSWRSASSDHIVMPSATFDGTTLCADTLEWIDRGTFSDDYHYKRTCTTNCVGDWAVAASDLPRDPPGPSAHMSCNYDSVAPGGLVAARVQCRNAYASEGQLCGVCERASTPQRQELQTCSPKGWNCRLAYDDLALPGEIPQGVLVCEGESLPAGSYRRTCEATTWDGELRRLCGFCKNTAGVFPTDARRQRLETCVKGCTGGFANANGVMACE